jgi:hypothetical protein
MLYSVTEYKAGEYSLGARTAIESVFCLVKGTGHNAPRTGILASILFFLACVFLVLNRSIINVTLG